MQHLFSPEPVTAPSPPVGGFEQNQYLRRGFLGRVRRDGDYADDWHHGGQRLRHRCGHRRKRRGNECRHHPNREWQRRGEGGHD